MEPKTAAVIAASVIVGIAIGALAGSAGGGTTADAPAPIADGTAEMGTVTIGHLHPVTGDLSQYGVDGRAMADAAEDDFNEYLAAVGADWRVSVAHEDTQTSPVTALEKLTSLKARGVDMVLGPYTSSDVSAVKGYADANNMILISPSSTAPQLAIPGDSVFRLVPENTKQGLALAKAFDHYGIERLVIIQRGDVWGDGLKTSTEESFENLGGVVDETIRYSPEVNDFAVSVSVLADRVRSHVEEVGASRVGVLVISFAETLEILQGAADYDVLAAVSWFCTEGIARADAIAADPIGLEFAKATDLQCSQSSTPRNAIRDSVDSRIVEAIGRTPSTFSYGSYDAIWLYGMSVLEIGEADPSKVKAALPGVARHYSGAIGSTLLNEAGDLSTSDYTLWRVGDSGWKEAAVYSSSSGTISELD